MLHSGHLRRPSHGPFRRRRVRTLAPALLGTFLFCVCVAAANADTVWLHNGDRLTGRILHLSPDALTLETTWAGEMTIRRFEIRAFETDKPVVLMRERRNRTEWGILKPGDPGRALLTPLSQEEVYMPHSTEGDAATAADYPGASQTPLDLASRSIRYINPTPEESGEGLTRDGRINVAGSLTRGNSDGERLYAEADFNAHARGWRYSIGLKAQRERESGHLISSNWLVSGNYDRFLAGSARFRYLRGSLENDRFRDIDLRATVGGGYGLQLLQTDRAALSVRSGLDAVAIQRDDGVDEHYPALGWGANFNYRLGWLSAEFFHEQTGYWNLRDVEQITFRSRSGIRLPLASGLNASLQWNLDWEGDPPEGQRTTDSRWLLGLGYAW